MVGDDFDKAAASEAKLRENSAALAEVISSSATTVSTGKALAIIAQGIDPDMRFQDDNTLLIIASFAASTEVVAALLLNGANPNLSNKRGETPLHYAAKAVMPGAVAALLKHGADIYARDEFGTSVESCAEKGTSDLSGGDKAQVIAMVRQGIQDRIMHDMNAALLRDEIKAFTTDGCATRTEVKPMKRLQLKLPGADS